MKKRHVHVRGKKIVVRSRRLRGCEGMAYKVTRREKENGTANPRHEPRRIELRKGIRGVRKLSTLLHEMIHQLDIGLAERTVLRLEEGLVQMVEDNPELFHELAHRLAAGEELA